MYPLYNALFTLGLLLSSPFYFLKMWRRGNWRAGFGQRFGKFDGKIKTALTNRHVLWIHAVSVGEVNIATQLIKQLELRAPNLTIVVSTTTSTGMGELHKKLPTHVLKIYYPIDRRQYVSRALRIINPEAIVLVEGEIWPNFIRTALARHIPLFLVNARLSERSYRGYRRFRFLFRPLFRAFSGVGAQNEADAEKLRKLGCAPEAIHVVGNLKFDAAKLDERPLMDARALLRQLQVPDDAPILVGGSTHAGEEKLLGEIFLRLRKQVPQLFLVLVPRHFERGKEVGEDLAAAGVPFVFRTEISATSHFLPGQVGCLVVNTTGELRYFYREAAVIFVGKSICGEGGQNPIEPGALGKAMTFGPNMQNFTQIAAAFVKGAGAVQVRNGDELERVLLDLLKSPARREELGRNALRVVAQNQGALERTVSMILERLHDGEIYISPAARAPSGDS